MFVEIYPNLLYEDLLNFDLSVPHAFEYWDKKRVWDLKIE